MKMKTLKNLTVIRHVPREVLGHWKSVFEKEGYRITYKDAGIDDLKRLKSTTIDVLCLLGGPLGACQDKEYPFLLDEISLIENRLKHDLPTIGICLGSQLMARALGQQVYANNCKEIGWAPLTLTKEGDLSCVKHLSAQQTSMFHWHNDTFDLPQGAKLLASTPHCKNQIFTFGQHVLAFQCHPEVSECDMEKWWSNAKQMLDEYSFQKLRKETALFAPQLKKQSEKCLLEWLNTIS